MKAEYKTKAQQKKFYNSAAWKGKQGIRQQALKRDNWECQECKKAGRVHVDSAKVEGERKSVQLNVHHIMELEDHPELALKLSNVTTVCLFHHNEIHKRFYGSRKIDEWRDEKW
ncbi:HNH endonuclease [Sporosarcina sp. FSL K6-5500]|uniref:HNH endonuclease n=1 Tax=Sporosarcina sp. FSL K6-5500 TaxID=2921558 RepID=UPI0030FCEA12